MRAAVVREFGGPEQIQVVDVAVPRPGPGEVLVKVAGSSINFADVFVRTGANVQAGATAPRPQFGLGNDVAGTVESVGKGVTGFAPGDAVIGTQERLDLPLGPQAEYVVLEEWALAAAPTKAKMAEAATLCMSGTTAYQALDALALDPGQWVLVTGAAGAVGLFAVELAVVRGLRVIAQAGEADEQTVRDRGAELFVPRGADLVTEVRRQVPGGVNGAVDAANLKAVASDAVGHGGAYVNLLLSAPTARREVRMVNLAWHTDAACLAELSRLADEGRLSLRVARTYPLDEIVEAHRAFESGGLRGRIVLVP